MNLFNSKGHSSIDVVAKLMEKFDHLRRNFLNPSGPLFKKEIPFGRIPKFTATGEVTGIKFLFSDLNI